MLCSTCVARCEAARFFRNMALSNDAKQRQLRSALISPEDPDCGQEEDLEESSSIDNETEYQDDVEEIDEEEQEDHFEPNIYETVTEEVVADELFNITYSNADHDDEDTCSTVSTETNAKPTVTRRERNSPAFTTRQGTFECQFCFTIYRFRTALMNHYQTNHPNELYMCAFCKKSFESAQTWRAHNCEHNKGHFVCEVCGKVFSHRSLMKSHMRIHSTDRHTCEFCAKKFVHKIHYQTHLKRHSEERNFACENCPKSFKERRELARHIQIVHTANRPFQCDECNRSFALKYMLTRHRQTHTGFRPHQCTVCGQKLSSLNALKHHMFTHTGAKPYTCQFCPAAYRIKANLKKHLKEHEAQATSNSVALLL